jgi:regulator of RNase E activity RraA
MNNGTYSHRLRELRSSVVSDVLDSMGVEGVISGLSPAFDQAVAIGLAMPVLVQAKPNALKGLREGLMDAIDLADKGSVMVIASDTQACSAWGGLVSRYAKLSGIAGAVVYGAARDIEDIIKLRLPVFSSTVTPISGYNRVEVLSPGAPVNCGSLSVQKGDLVVADRDGVAIVPSAMTREVLDQAFRLLEKEDQHIDDIQVRLRKKRHPRTSDPSRLIRQCETTSKSMFGTRKPSML